MSDICGIISDLKREEQGVYVFKKLTLMGFDRGDEELSKLQSLGYKITDENARFEGVEILNCSPFKLMRSLATEFGFKVGKPANSNAPGDRQSVIWTLLGGEAEEAIGIIADIKRESEGEYVIPTSTVFGLTREELAALAQKGLSIDDSNKRIEGVEITGCSPFKVMRLLCKDHGWTTDGEIMQFEAPGDRTACMWTLTRKI